MILTMIPSPFIAWRVFVSKNENSIFRAFVLNDETLHGVFLRMSVSITTPNIKIGPQCVLVGLLISLFSSAFLTF